MTSIYEESNGRVKCTYIDTALPFDLRSTPLIFYREVPQELINKLLTGKPDWTSNTWTLWFHYSFLFLSTLHTTFLRISQRRYCQFCLHAKKPSLPVAEDKLCSFAVHLANDGLTYQSHLSAIKHLQVESGLVDPRIGDMPRLEHVLKGKSLRKKRKSTSKPRLP